MMKELTKQAMFLNFNELFEVVVVLQGTRQWPVSPSYSCGDVSPKIYVLPAHQPSNQPLPEDSYCDESRQPMTFNDCLRDTSLCWTATSTKQAFPELFELEVLLFSSKHGSCPVQRIGRVVGEFVQYFQWCIIRGSYS